MQKLLIKLGVALLTRYATKENAKILFDRCTEREAKRVKNNDSSSNS